MTIITENHHAPRPLTDYEIALVGGASRGSTSQPILPSASQAPDVTASARYCSPATGLCETDTLGRFADKVIFADFSPWSSVW